MTGATSALAVLDFDASGAAIGHRLLDPAAPALAVTELAATRGDGVFETVGLIGGRPLKLARHLARFAVSAQLLDLPEPDPAVWGAALLEVAAALDPAEDAYVKLVLSRGIEGGDRPTGWAYGQTHPSYADVQRDGVRVVVLDRGYRHDVARTSRWLLQGAKTLSYAVNRAAAREATRRDADDVVFESSDGFLLEGPTSTLVLRTGDTLRTSRTDLGILAGTTQAELFAWAEGEGYATSYDLLTRDDLTTADGAWLVSSVRLVVPIRAVDGIPRPIDAPLTAAFNTHLRSLAAPAAG